ncbi:histone-lysine N-methyltransferase SETD8-A [Elysia marginata]|uniref:Histone-lysine N-methyltransferase SETD8-A n=1 Tax=Elysia marginata TaxID=1093978 RepID=A0AAV4ITL7_9GAST|nr:histone-lysine N-methyltransferase SETD8-A [Elysia marginata]
MPDNDDVETLRNYYILDEFNAYRPYDLWDDSLFVKLRNLIITQVTMLNARRSGEPARLTIREWTDASPNAWIDPQLTEQIKNSQERLLLKNMKLAYQAGKGSRELVPVLFPKDTMGTISKLMERTNCSIHPDNIIALSQHAEFTGPCQRLPLLEGSG